MTAKAVIDTQGKIADLFRNYLNTYQRELSELRYGCVVLDKNVTDLNLLSEMDVILDEFVIPLRIIREDVNGLLSYHDPIVLCIGKSGSMFTRSAVFKISNPDYGDMPQVWEIEN